MIDRIRRFFQEHVLEPSHRQLDGTEQVRLATAALFIEMSRADFDITPEEREAVLHAVTRVLELGAAEASELVALADEQVAESVSLFQFTHLVNGEFTPEQKLEVVEWLWRIAFADRVVQKHEEFLVRKVANLLHVPHRDFIAAKQRARGQSGH